MKKIIAVILVTALTLSSFAVAFGKSESSGKAAVNNKSGSVQEKQEKKVDNKHGQDKNTGKVVKQESTKKIEKNETKSKIDALMEELKLNHKDKAKRKELIKKIVALRKKNKDNTIPVIVNGEIVKFDVAPVVKNHRTLVPVKAITKALGAEVEFDDANKTMTVTKAVYSEQETVTGSVYEANIVEIKITFGSNIALVNGKEVDMGVSPSKSKGTLVPIRFIAETFGMKVESESGAVVVEYDTPVVNTNTQQTTNPTNQEASTQPTNTSQ